MNTRKNNRVKGNYGERLAIEYLVNNGWKIIEQNYNTNIGEIDIIALDNDYLVFVEVKSRNSLKYGYPYEAVNKIKINKIINTALQYIVVKNIVNRQIRFDIIEVYLKENRINHYENAFQL